MVGVVGRMSGQKDITLTLNTYAEVLKLQPSTHLVLVGDGEDMAMVRNWIERSRLPNIHILGALSPDRVAAVYAAVDAYLLTSKWEGMPMSLLEALACGTPSVTTPVGECPALLRGGKAGFVSGSRDPKDLAALVARVLAGECSTEACREIAGKFSAATMSEALWRVLTNPDPSGADLPPSHS